MNYPFMKLEDIKNYVPEMKRLRVSIVARGKAGFLTEYTRLKGKSSKLSKEWIKKRKAFIYRTLPAYKQNPTYRRGLSLIAWAYYVDLSKTTDIDEYIEWKN